MRLRVEAAFGCPAGLAWDKVQTPGLLAAVFRPLLRFLPPLGRHAIHFERLDPKLMEIQTRGGKAWSARPALHADEVEINTGLPTPTVWLFARWLYRHRQRRWKAIERLIARREAGAGPGISAAVRAGRCRTIMDTFLGRARWHSS
jgi:hypothetical protein